MQRRYDTGQNRGCDHETDTEDACADDKSEINTHGQVAAGDFLTFVEIGRHPIDQPR